MKKLFTLLIIAISFLCQQASAQIKKGEKMLGANIGLNSSKTKQSNTSTEGTGTNISIVPQLGFGIGNNWIVGVQVGYYYSRQKITYPLNGITEQKTNTLLGGLFARKFFPMGERFGLFGQGDLSYSRTKDKYNSTPGGSNGQSNTHSIIAAVSPGAYFRTSKRFILEAQVGSLGYEHRTSKPEGGGNKTTSNTVFLSLSNNLSIGFKVVL